MQPEPVAKISSPRRKFFLLGVLFELLLIACSFLPESWLAVEIRNFTLVVHIPLLVLLESGLGETAPTAILTLLAGFAVMSCLWGFLIFLVTKGIGSLLIRLNRNQKRFVWLGVGLIGLVCLAWAGISMLPETPRPFESSSEIKSVVDANNAFALDLYQKLKDKPGNLFFSPYSISSALAMTCAGARGQTEMEMTNTLHFNLPSEKLHPAFKALTARLDGLQRWNRIALKCANSLWCQKDHQFTGDFLKTVRENYSAEARSVDFKNSPEAADEINRWIDAKTNHKIPDGIAPEQITPLTRLVLSDAIYFNGKWQHQFKVRDTKPTPFHVSTNETVTVPMMYQKEHFKMALSDDDSVEMLELPYAGTDLSMIILLPSDAKYYFPEAGLNDVQALEQKLTADNLRTWLKKLDQADLHETWVALPRFTTMENYDLVRELKSLGMTSAFSSDAADFSGMDGTTNLFVSDVIHKAFVKVDESGTEAAAVTMVLVKTKGQIESFIVDHPFIFLIRDNGSGNILFLGKIIDPTK